MKIESHLLDFDAQLYGLEVEVVLLHFLRDERKFSGIDELKVQIQEDIAEARRYFDERK
ncbi:Riboflavin biosynthesis protein RibF [compost metagenome]